MTDAPKKLSEMSMNARCRKEIEALKLLNRNWDSLSDDDQRGKHDTLMWTIDALVEVGLVDIKDTDKTRKGL